MPKTQHCTFLTSQDVERLTALEKTLSDILDEARHEGAEYEDEPARLADRVHDDIGDALRTVEQFDLEEQPGAAEKLPGIAKLASMLAERLNGLCGSEHVRETAAREDSLEPARAVRAAFERQCEVMTIEKAAAELRGFQVDVHKVLGVEHEYENEYAVVWRCSENGVRYALAQALTLDALLPPDMTEPEHAQ